MASRPETDLITALVRDRELVRACERQLGGAWPDREESGLTDAVVRDLEAAGYPLPSVDPCEEIAAAERRTVEVDPIDPCLLSLAGIYESTSAERVIQTAICVAKLEARENPYRGPVDVEALHWRFQLLFTQMRVAVATGQWIEVELPAGLVDQFPEELIDRWREEITLLDGLVKEVADGDAALEQVRSRMPEVAERIEADPESCWSRTRAIDAAAIRSEFSNPAGLRRTASAVVHRRGSSRERGARPVPVRSRGSRRPSRGSDDDDPPGESDPDLDRGPDGTGGAS